MTPRQPRVIEILRSHAHNDPEKVALTAPRAANTVLGVWNGDAEFAQWNYRELYEEVLGTAEYLQKTVQCGERIGICAANTAEWVFAFLGAICANLPVVIVNPSSPEAELEELLSRAGVSLVIQTRTHRDQNRNQLVPHEDGHGVLYMEDWTRHIVATSKFEPAWKTPNYVNKPAVIQYTSGSTGPAKGVLLSEPSLVWNGMVSADSPDLAEGVTSMIATPLSHVGGYAQFLLGGLLKKRHLVVVGGFDAKGYLDTIERFQVVTTGAVPTMWRMILDEQYRNPRDLSSVQVVSSGATSQPESIVREVIDVFDARYQVYYGMTETAGAVSGTQVDDPVSKSWSSVGRPLAQTQVRIDPLESGSSDDPIGEIVVKSPGVMLGYLDNPTASKETLDADGWLRTGDLGLVDAEGYLYIRGRIGSMIIKGGENISPDLLEEAILRLDGVAEAAVYPVPDQKWGEVPAATLVLSADVSLESLAQACSDQIGSFRTPTHWDQVEQLPRNANQKIDKLTLKNTFAPQFSRSQ